MRHMIHRPCGDWCLVENVHNIILNRTLKRPEWMKTLIPIIVDEIMAKILNIWCW